MRRGGLQQTPAVTLTPWSPYSIAPSLTGTRLNVAASAVWPTANQAYYVPVWLPAPFTIVKLFAINGAVASGNIDVGVYTEDGTRIVSAGSTAQSGTDTIQEFDVADTAIGPGRYYLGIAMDNTRGTVYRQTVGAARLIRYWGVLLQSSAFPLPATATFAAMTQDFLPVFGATSRTVI